MDTKTGEKLVRLYAEYVTLLEKENKEASELLSVYGRVLDPVTRAKAVAAAKAVKDAIAADPDYATETELEKKAKEVLEAAAKLARELVVSQAAFEKTALKNKADAEVAELANEVKTASDKVKTTAEKAAADLGNPTNPKKPGFTAETTVEGKVSFKK